MDYILTRFQQAALNDIRSSSALEHASATRNLRELEGHQLEALLTYVSTKAPILIYFNPRTTLQHLLDGTHYKNQHELTIPSSGALSHLPSRDQWENRLFHGAYASAEASEKPKYGCLNITGHKCGLFAAENLTNVGPADEMKRYGPMATQYGDSFLMLKREVRNRATWCHRDSSKTGVTPADLGTFEYFSHVLTSLKRKNYVRSWLQLRKAVADLGFPSTGDE